MQKGFHRFYSGLTFDQVSVCVGVSLLMLRLPWVLRRNSCYLCYAEGHSGSSQVFLIFHSTLLKQRFNSFGNSFILVARFAHSTCSLSDSWHFHWCSKANTWPKQFRVFYAQGVQICFYFHLIQPEPNRSLILAKD